MIAALLLVVLCIVLIVGLVCTVFVDLDPDTRDKVLDHAEKKFARWEAKLKRWGT